MKQKVATMYFWVSLFFSIIKKFPAFVDIKISHLSDLSSDLATSHLI